MLRISFEYICYRILAPHRKGYGIHSPFVFSLFTNVFRKDDDENLDGIKRWRNELSRQNLYIETEDIGAGSQISFRKRRSVKNIIRWSSITHKYGRILYFTAKYFEPATIIELGTGLGISTAYLSSAVPSAKMISIDADRAMHEFASAKIKDHTHNMPEFCLGRFEEFLLSKLNNAEHPLLIFIDGDHQYEPKEITTMIDKIREGYDVVTGFRGNRADTWNRRFISKVYNYLFISTFFRMKIRDQNSGFKAFDTKFARKMRFDPTGYHGIHRFILPIAKYDGAKIAEIPISHFDRKAGKSYIKTSTVPFLFLSDLFLRFIPRFRKDIFSHRK